MKNQNDMIFSIVAGFLAIVASRVLFHEAGAATAFAARGGGRVDT
jgi:hypothetical protein